MSLPIAAALEMLPDSKEGEYFDVNWWTQWKKEVATPATPIPAPPAATELAKARDNRNALQAAVDVERMIYVAGTGSNTPAGLHKNSRGEPEWLATASGDGTVPYELGLLIDEKLRPVPTYYMAAKHGDLANHPAAFEALDELLEDATGLPFLTSSHQTHDRHCRTTVNFLARICDSQEIIIV